MDWNGTVRNAAAYIEDNLTLSFTAKDIADHIHYSSFYFQRVFRDTCGMSVGEYVRRRRLSRAAVELVRTDIRILDLAVKYGYDSPDSFTRAFTKFHGSTPSEVRAGGVTAKNFPQLQAGYIKEGETEMEYRLEKKPSFKVMGVSKNFDFEDCQKKIPLFWDDVLGAPEGAPVCGMYGICFDTPLEGDQFRYMIADDLVEETAEAKGLEVLEIPEYNWVVVPCRGPIPDALQATNNKIFSEWLPASDFEPAGDFNIEYYSDASGLELGTKDPDYYTEIWIPVK